MIARHIVSFALAVVVGAACGSMGSAQAEDTGGGAGSNLVNDGTRYGQAAGAALVCIGVKVTPLAATLRAKYQGAELADFDARAGKIVAAWKDVLSCRNAGGPNPCKLSHMWSCQEAMREIGPNGTALAGLLEPSR